VRTQQGECRKVQHGKRQPSSEKGSLRPTKGKTSDRIIRKPIATKATQQVGSSIELQDVGNWTFWKVRPPPKRKKEQKTTGDPESVEPGNINSLISS
jgi:hypothetical protein